MTNKRSEEEKGKCFVITPIGQKETPIRRHIDGIIDQAIIPALSNKFKILVAHRENELGSINDRIIRNIYNADLVIANLTELNPNVMFELAIRYSYGKPAIIIAEEGIRLPFDIVTENTIFYVNDPQGADDLKQGLIEFEEKINYEIETHGPIYGVIKSLPIYNKVESEETISSDEMMRYIVSNMEILMKKSSQSNTLLTSNNVEVQVTIKKGSEKDINGFKVEFNKTLTAYVNQVDKISDGDNNIMIKIKSNIDKDHVFDLCNDITTISETNNVDIKVHVNY